MADAITNNQATNQPNNQYKSMRNFVRPLPPVGSVACLRPLATVPGNPARLSPREIDDELAIVGD